MKLILRAALHSLWPRRHRARAYRITHHHGGGTLYCLTCGKTWKTTETPSSKKESPT